MQSNSLKPNSGARKPRKRVLGVVPAALSRAVATKVSAQERAAIKDLDSRAVKPPGIDVCPTIVVLRTHSARIIRKSSCLS